MRLRSYSRLDQHLDFSKLLNIQFINLSTKKQSGEITELQADALLMSQHNIIEDKIDLAAINAHNSVDVNKDVIRVGHAFNKTITLIWDCFYVCGLKEYIVIMLYMKMDNFIRLISTHIIFFVDYGLL